jgi:hypothetical protein
MRRYTNWGLIILGGLLATVALASPIWIPLIQPYLVDDEALSDFVCSDFVSGAQCDVLQGMYLEDPDKALSLSNLINPDNDFEVFDPSPSQLEPELQRSIGSSDALVTTIVKDGVFGAPRDAIHNATGEIKYYQIVTVDNEVVLELIRLESQLEAGFTVTYVPDLTLYLSQHENPTSPAEIFSGEGGAFEVAALKGNKGNQNYEIGVEFDPTKYKSAVIYSPELEQIFGVAIFN